MTGLRWRSGDRVEWRSKVEYAGDVRCGCMRKQREGVLVCDDDVRSTCRCGWREGMCAWRKGREDFWARGTANLQPSICRVHA